MHRHWVCAGVRRISIVRNSRPHIGLKALVGAVVGPMIRSGTTVANYRLSALNAERVSNKGVQSLMLIYRGIERLFLFFIHRHEDTMTTKTAAAPTMSATTADIGCAASAITAATPAATPTLAPGAPSIRHGAWAAGSDAPEKKEVRIGFIPLTDCASVVMASVLKFDEKYGIKIIPTKESSWASVRDKLISGELDGAHVLYGLIYGLQLGIGGPKKDMATLMNLNNNGQAITISKKLASAPAKCPAG